ncbi:MAG: hypothetical protein BWZ05_01858 [Bacteroidetes bacterium ADurb.BinA245]|mgnify:FL=1|jgi:hypothetical protein|nr:MAG: hypothetical protein BWZ05_01858 [Bacteroidetes bacterium ADurb.BinA245]
MLLSKDCHFAPTEQRIDCGVLRYLHISPTGFLEYSIILQIGLNISFIKSITEFIKDAFGHHILVIEDNY